MNIQSVIKYAAVAAALAMANPAMAQSSVKDLADMASAAMDAARERSDQAAAPEAVKAIFAKAAAQRAEAERETAAEAERKVLEASKGTLAKLAPDMVPIPGQDYSICKYEVTQALWFAVMGENPSEFKGADRPVENVSWDDCQKFLEKLNALPEVKASGKTYRLPTADEWEFACRAGATGDYCKLADGTEITGETLGEVAWYDDNSEIDGRRQTHPVGQKKPNAFGLYDMHGNAWEWTSTAVGRFRVCCGGSWMNRAYSCEAGRRPSGNPVDRGNGLGFRLAAVSAERAEAERKVLLEASKGALAKLAPDMVPIPGQDYSICKYEVTQALWFAVMGENPSEFKGADRPVENVSWDDCQKFLEKLNALPEVKASGKTYRLPTADEWEFACRAGATGDYCRLADGTEISKATLGDVAWYGEGWETGATHPVGQKKPNAFGLYDMHGNVSEWTSTADGNNRVSCGGSWRYSASRCKADYRGGSLPDYRGNFLGFRLAR